MEVNDKQFKIEIWIVHALDHYSSDDRNEEACIVRYIGEKIGENDNFIILRPCKADINNDDSGEDIYFVLKGAIIGIPEKIEVEIPLDIYLQGES